MDKVLTTSTAVFAGLGTTLSLVSVPALLSSSDPLPVWRLSYKYGARYAVASILVASASATKCYLKTNDNKYLIVGSAMFAVIPFTIAFMKPINDELLSIESSDSQVVPLIRKWNRFQWVRTTIGVFAFTFNLFYIQ